MRLRNGRASRDTRGIRDTGKSCSRRGSVDGSSSGVSGHATSYPISRCAASTTFAGQRQLFLPVKGQQREHRWRPQRHSVLVVGWSRPLAGTFFSPIQDNENGGGGLWEI